ncbi:hypothetical protein D3C80_863020 [compost metagenome]
MPFGFQFCAVFVGDAFGAHQLLPGRQKPNAIELRPAVELAGGELDEVRFQCDAQLDDAVDLVDIVPMGDEVQHHRITVGLHRPGHFQFLREGLFRAGQQIVHLLVTGLETDLDVIETGLLEVADFLFGQADAGGDQVGIETQLARFNDQLGEVLTHQRFATGKAKLRGAHFPRFTKHLDPLLGAQLFALLGEIQRIGAVRALQRAAIGQLGEQPQRQADFRFWRHLP